MRRIGAGCWGVNGAIGGNGEPVVRVVKRRRRESGGHLYRHLALIDHYGAPRLRRIKPAFHDADTDTDILARIVADTSDTRDFLRLFLRQAERHADILATILARMSVSVSASWNAAFSDDND